MEDLISRQAAIEALHMHLMYRMGTDSNKKRLDEWINNLPSAQPEPCADAVSRPLAIGAAIESVDEWDGGYNVQRANMIRDAIKNLPSAQPERKKGKWIYSPEYKIIGNPYGHYRCDQCQTIVGYETHFCPNCGADMRGEQE